MNYNLNKNEIIVKKQIEGKTFESVAKALFKKTPDNGNLFFKIKDKQIFNRYCDNSNALCKENDIEPIENDYHVFEVEHYLFADTIIKKSAKKVLDFNERKEIFEFYPVFPNLDGRKIISSDCIISIDGVTKDGCLIVEDWSGQGFEHSEYIIGITSPSTSEKIRVIEENRKKIQELKDATAKYYIGKYDFNIKSK